MVEWREKLDFCFLVGLRGCEREREREREREKYDLGGIAVLMLCPRASVIDRRTS